jgi:hypothetical protein
MTEAPKLEWHRFAGLRASGVGLTEYFIIIVEQDESGFRAVTVRPRGATYPTLEEAKGHCETEHRIRWKLTREEAERKAALKAQKAALKKQRED